MFPQRGAGAIAQAYSVYAGDDTDAAIAALTPLLGAGALLDQQAQLVPYHAVVPPHGGPHVGGAAPAFRAGLLDHVTPESAAALMALVESGDAPMMQLRPIGGAVHDVDPMATAFAHRSSEFVASAVGMSLGRLSPAWDAGVAPFTRGLYASFNTDPRPERVEEAFPGETLVRLRRLKATYDPDGVFEGNLPIGPQALV